MQIISFLKRKWIDTLVAGLINKINHLKLVFKGIFLIELSVNKFFMVKSTNIVAVFMPCHKRCVMYYGILYLYSNEKYIFQAQLFSYYLRDRHPLIKKTLI